jgi:hypothetical protein
MRVIIKWFVGCAMLVIATFFLLRAFNTSQSPPPFSGVEDGVIQVRPGEVVYVGWARQPELASFRAGAKLKLVKGLGVEMISPLSIATEMRSIKIATTQVANDVEIRLDNSNQVISKHRAGNRIKSTPPEI